MEHRDRASGWKHAKLSGHSNESLVKKLLDTDKAYLQSLLNRMGYGNEVVVETSIGGLYETNVPSVIGNKTKSKTDLKIKCQSGREINVSIKKSLGGQVYFVRAGLFIEVFEKQFRKKIPSNVVRAIELVWAAAEDAPDIIEDYANKNDKKTFNLQVKHKSLNATTLKNYNSDLYNALLRWFKDNAYELAKISFTMGAVRDKNEWPEFVWYKNCLGENDIDEIFYIDDICNAVCKFANTETFYGTKNGGTTIKLPFGFVQWHQAKMQFHHNFDKVSGLLKEEL